MSRYRTPSIVHFLGRAAFLFLIGSASAFAQPADPDASDATVELHQRMLRLVEKGIMFGHQDDIVYGHSWKYEGESDVKQVAGDYPAVFGWEIGDVELGNDESLDGVAFSKIREGMRWAHAHGGINTISWHGANAVTGGDTWDVSSNEVVRSILPGGAKEAEFVEQLDYLVEFFLSVKSEDGTAIPLIFRPYHEHTGSWFWWGQKLCTKDEYVSLWRYTIDYLRAKGVHNLLLAYSSAGGFQNAEAFLERYPGDDLIDIVGFDTYQRGVEGRERYVDGLKRGLEIVVAIGKEKGKIVILAETGIESVSDPVWWTKTLWDSIAEYPLSYALVWRNAYDRPKHFYAPYPGQASEEDFKKFAAEERTLFLKDVQ